MQFHVVDSALADKSRFEEASCELEESGVSLRHPPESERFTTFGNADPVLMRPIGDLFATDEVPPPAEAQQGCVSQYGLEKPTIVA